jgi:hypothetical protein
VGKKQDRENKRKREQEKERTRERERDRKREQENERAREQENERAREQEKEGSGDSVCACGRKVLTFDEIADVRGVDGDKGAHISLEGTC